MTGSKWQHSGINAITRGRSTLNTLFCPRVVQAVSLFIQNFTQPGDAIVSLTPAYHPISHAVEVNHRVLLESALLYRDHHYEIDFADLEDKFKMACCFILISPHNPTGTIWSEDNLRKIASLAEKYNIFIISDDVHADFNFSPKQHQTISSISSYVAQNSFICTSPAKTFNMAGLEIANIVIANDKYREQFKLALIAAGIHNPGLFPLFLHFSVLTPWRFLVSSIKRLFGRKQELGSIILPSSFSRLVCRLWWRNLHVVDRLMGNEHQRSEQLRHWFVSPRRC